MGDFTGEENSRKKLTTGFADKFLMRISCWGSWLQQTVSPASRSDTLPLLISASFNTRLVPSANKPMANGMEGFLLLLIGQIRWTLLDVQGQGAVRKGFAHSDIRRPGLLVPAFELR